MSAPSGSVVPGTVRVALEEQHHDQRRPIRKQVERHRSCRRRPAPCRSSIQPAARARRVRHARTHRAAASSRATALRLDSADHRHVRVLQAGPAHLQVADARRRAGRTARARTGWRRRWRARSARRRGSSAPRPAPDTCRASSSALPSATIRPPARIMIRSASFSASSRSCVVSRIVVSSMSASRCTRSWKSRRACGSKPAVGSSRNSSSGRPTMPIATSSRRRCPPDSVPIRGRRLGQADRRRAARRRRTAGRSRRGVRRVVARRGGAAARGPASLPWSRQDCSTIAEAGPASARRRCAGSTPSTVTSPADRIRKPSRISIVVVLPAPFGPSSASTSPRRALKSTPSQHVVRRRSASAGRGPRSRSCSLPYCSNVIL